MSLKLKHTFRVFKQFKMNIYKDSNSNIKVLSKLVIYIHTKMISQAAVSCAPMRKRGMHSNWECIVLSPLSVAARHRADHCRVGTRSDSSRIAVESWSRHRGRIVAVISRLRHGQHHPDRCRITAEIMRIAAELTRGWIATATPRPCRSR